MRAIVRDVMYGKLQELYDAWERQRPAPDKLPGRPALKVMGLNRFAKNLVMIEVDGDSYVYRHYGAQFVESFGKDMTGADISTLPDEQMQLIKFEYDHVRKKRGPTWRSYTGDFDGELVTWERLALPISTDGETIDLLIVAAYEIRKR